MKANEFIGIIPPVLSSFNKEGKIYERGIREIIRFTLPFVNGYYPIGTYGCGPLMSIEERKQVLEIIIDEVGGRVPVVAHVGHAGTIPTIELALHAKKIGADGVGAISPYYSPGIPEDNLYHHFVDLINAVNEDGFPVFVYNNVHYSQNAITPALLKRLADYGLRGCKDSSFDIVNFFNYQEAVSDYKDFNLIVGTEAFFVSAFDAGARGTVCGLANIFPDLLKKIYDEYMNEDGDRKQVIELQRIILKIRKLIKSGPTVPIFHAILRMKGIDCGYARSPMIEIDDETKSNVISGIKKLNIKSINMDITN